MALVLVIFLKLFFLLVTEGSLINESVSSNISLGSSLNTDTNRSWLSPSGLFAFGFYQQDGGFAVGIWLTTKPDITVVWTANRDDPPLSSNSTIKLTGDGRLLLFTTYGEQKSITNTYSELEAATSASMFDSGNFVLYNHSEVIWQSFDYPSDTILGGQTLTPGGLLVSSVSASHHSSGSFVLEMQTDGNLVACPRNSPRGPSDAYWVGGMFGLLYSALILNLNGSLCTMNGETQKLINPSSRPELRKDETVVFRATLNSQGNFVLYSHRFRNLFTNSTGMMEWEALRDPCKVKGICGANSYCYTTAGKAECRCFPGFLFFNSSRNGKSLGCYRNFTEETCSQGGLQLSHNITALDNMKAEVFPYSVLNLSKEACINVCLDDCNCWVGLYANDSCMLLKVPVIYSVLDKSILATVFIKTSFPKAKHQLHKPLPALKSPEQGALAERRKLVSILAITLGFFALMCTLMAFSSFFYYRVRAHRYQRMSQNVDFGLTNDHFTLRSFSFEELHKATDGFKEVIGRNSIGGEVYKGFISEGKKAVAVKRLHTRMLEGDRGFRAEITAIAQTHHRNLVRLLGFCIHGAAKLLVYEFMSNGSLADLLLKPETLPGWKERVSLALDVARGILYLHQECETRIIHCNIKPHNILFDESSTAKISDFGLSKLLRQDQSGTLTGVRGTRGYMAPEWHKNTLISTKVDIYSFGVVLLEILCCTGDMKIDISCEDKISFFTWVYRCFVVMELKSLVGDEEVDIHMFEKMVKVGLLCIQDDPEARPSIKDVILMLEGTTDIPIPPSPVPSLI
ncbi:putative protein kinase RLK-Pelle-SD-2b family [Helianthus annuus]|uniref:Receptor-like serine/threonine-protein kinase n=1 Tax=Helianthus annuus TaxID=4232 RepID=A0A251VG95_HELAN|nr:G-type lectin S-receptor-like serine/threonine-protein kinase LECRK3 [Helianthus annuus]KAF5818706.1 putative protein kinase RLK-Pelle-SD-2b family [Helianthus annuus]KAJ0604952.1 putative protein kinase RLK-Pelle-SD-2b family [Helianthus annuus]KAJ0618967.1 putative protein kinase RLK-Pelle-SD-2b family [Helianthus annuus]KAJ0777422.1 putative protein kinase RLK-Pelle-SD-2b family [Helianthus annuus]